MHYCEYCQSLEGDNLHVLYHNTQYGFPILNDNELFGRLILEINQAGLSWHTILKKQDNFRQAFDGFDIQKIAAYGNTDINRLLNDAGIIRNKLKINAVIHNAQQILILQEKHGSLKGWLDDHHPLPLKDWVKLFKNTFKFTGGEITNEFLMSTGYLDGAHQESCPIHSKIISLNPMWLNS